MLFYIFIKFQLLYLRSQYFYKIQNKKSNWLDEYLENNNLETFVIGISGGIDSAVTSTLCAMTGKRTIVVTLPIHQNPDETYRGLDHIDWLKDNSWNVEIPSLLVSDPSNEKICEAPRQTDQTLKVFSPDN